jgi:hypothetical protein
MRPPTRTRYGYMRLTRLRAVNEVRSTDGSPQGEPEVKPARKESIPGPGAHGVDGDGMSGSARYMNQGDLPWGRKEQGRSQSPRSSEEAANHRGAKGGRKVEA